MAYEIVKVRQNTYEVYSEGQERVARGNRRGELVSIPSFLQASFDKKVFQASIGTASTPVSFAKTAYDADQPQLVIDVPSGTTIVPLELEITLEDSAGTDNEVIWGCAGDNVGAGTSTAVTAAPGLVNLYIPASGAAPASRCSVYRQYTGNGTDITDDTDFFEFYRETYAFADATTDPIKKFRWSAMQSPAPIINGTGSLVLWVVAASTAPAGFVRAKWWELSSEEV